MRLTKRHVFTINVDARLTAARERTGKTPIEMAIVDGCFYRANELNYDEQVQLAVSFIQTVRELFRSTIVKRK